MYILPVRYSVIMIYAKKAEDAEKCSSNFHNFFRWKVFSHLIECVVSRSGFTRDTDKIGGPHKCLPTPKNLGL